MNARDIARSVLHATPDRMRNYIELDGERIELEPKPTLEEAKAQWADALWIIEGLIKKGQGR